MHKITFFPLGNADSSLIELENEKVILIDFANKKNPDDPEDKRIDLEEELDLRVKKDIFDVVCITHLDNDHYKGCTDYFYLEHDSNYQSNDRKRIAELWVPVAVFLEDEFDYEEAEIIQKEAIYRFKNGAGIKVFSKPSKLKEWCSSNGIDFESRQHLIVDAGSIIDTFSKVYDGIEFFVHSPFQAEVEGETIDRNKAAITLHATFNNYYETKAIFGSDLNWEKWKDIVTITKFKSNQEKLEWDIFHVSHHCSYLSLSDHKGEDKTTPVEEIKWMFEDQGRSNGYIISPSKIIPKKGSDEDVDNNPPHRQAANYYKEVIRKISSNNSSDHFKVTMEFPSKETPKPMTFEIGDHSGITLKKTVVSTASFISSRPAPRAG